MNEILKKALPRLKSPRVIVAIGLAGILLIFLSSCFEGGKNEALPEAKEISVEEYREELENQVKTIVSGISGDENATVVLTLESGVRYSYVDSVSADSTALKEENGDEESREKTTRSFVTVRTSDGGEQALLVTETMPKVRGVAIVCVGGEDDVLSEKIENAVMAALDITSKRVYIAGGSSYEKR